MNTVVNLISLCCVVFLPHRDQCWSIATTATDTKSTLEARYRGASTEETRVCDARGTGCIVNLIIIMR